MNYLLNQSLNESVPVTIIYLSKDNSLSKRVILVKAKNDSYIRAFCYTKRQVRIFKIDSILAVEPIKRRTTSYA